jgi:hypothetical protein
MYEIPQQLEYKERIVFGLTFGQLAYAFLFGFISIIFFKLNIPLPFKIFLILIPMSLATGFMFFDLTTRIRNFVTWYKFREIKLRWILDQLFGIKEIKGDYIYLK